MAKKNHIILLFPLILTGCVTGTPVLYSPNDFVNPNKIIVKKVKTPILPEVKATYGIGSDPAVIKAYNQYTKTGTMQTIRSKGWITAPFSSESRPLISCQPLRLCVVQLEAGEKLNSVNIGDSMNWKIGEFLTGRGVKATTSISVKPVFYNLATDMVISTDKRTYNIGLVSKKGSATSVLRFYYPQETLLNSVKKVQEVTAKAINFESENIKNTKIDLNHINFNYKISGSQLPWRPTRVFDDSNKTFIQIPEISSRFSLPVLYLEKNNHLTMVNYRYRKPYFIVDGLFKNAWLISGKGKTQIKVEIHNKNMG